MFLDEHEATRSPESEHRALSDGFEFHVGWSVAIFLSADVGSVLI